MDYAEQALHGEQVEAMLAALQRRILHSCQRADLAIAPRDFIDLAHYRHNDSEANYAPYPYLAQLAERLFGAQGGGNALICGEQTLTYRELGQRIATAIANLQNRGVQPGNVVALYLPRSPEQIILSLACALQGVIWVPVDINSPPERTAYLLENCRPTLVVHGGDLETPIGVTPATLLAPTDRTPALPDEQTLVERSASQAASYYLYTSGTTGKPKCVVLNNRATANVVHQTQQRWAVTADDVFISVTPPHHDMSMFDLFGSLCAGATLVLPAPHQEKDAISWNQLVEKHRVTLWCSVPAILEMLLTCKTADSLRSLRLVAQGGDYIKPATVQTLRTLRPDLALFSLGGPTETTIWSIWHPIAPQEKAPCLTAARCRPTATSSAMTTAATARPAWSAASIPPGSTWRWATWSRGAEAARFRYPRRAGWATAARFSHRRSRLLPGGRQHHVRHPGERLCEDPRRARLVAGNRRRAAPPSGDPGHGGGGLPQRREQRGGARCPVSDPRRYPLPLSEIRAFATGYLPCTHIPTRFIHAEALPLSANGKTDRHRIRADLSHQQTAPALNACAAPPPNAPLARSADPDHLLAGDRRGTAPGMGRRDGIYRHGAEAAAYQTGGGTPQ